MKSFKWLTELETYEMSYSCSQRLLKIFVFSATGLTHKVVYTDLKLLHTRDNIAK
jgi:hypothetical protein